MSKVNLFPQASFTSSSSIWYGFWLSHLFPCIWQFSGFKTLESHETKPRAFVIFSSMAFFWQRGRNILTGIKKGHCLHPKYSLLSFSVVCAESDFASSWLHLLFYFFHFSWANRCHEVELQGHSNENMNLGAVCSALDNVTFQFGEKFPILFFSPGKIPVFSTLQRSDEKSFKAVNEEIRILWLLLYCVHAENPFWLPQCKCT